MVRIFVLGISALLLGSCGTIKVNYWPKCSYYSDMAACMDSRDSRDIAIFFDGTKSDQRNDSNIAKLYNITTLNGDSNIRAYYVPGVGIEFGKITTGSIFGKGIDERVKLAYLYIAQNYRQEHGDEIHLFGFSRGAYSARILAGLIYVADLPDLTGINGHENQLHLVEQIYAKYRDKSSIEEKRAKISDIPGYFKASSETKINFMGLFDTVPSLAYDYWGERKIKYLSEIYEDQICNVDKVAHAMSIDDNRVHSFTPSPMKVRAIAADCEGLGKDQEKISQKIADVITEVWFSGAHSDVGGGYPDSDLSGVPMNWMIRQMSHHPSVASILPITYNDINIASLPFVPEDVYGLSHIGEDSLRGSPYVNRNRAIPEYVRLHFDEGHRNIVIHDSVIARRAVVPRTRREFDFNPDPEEKVRNYARCFTNEYLQNPPGPRSSNLAKYVLRYTPKYNDKCFEIDELGRYTSKLKTNGIIWPQKD